MIAARHRSRASMIEASGRPTREVPINPSDRSTCTSTTWPTAPWSDTVWVVATISPPPGRARPRQRRAPATSTPTRSIRIAVRHARRAPRASAPRAVAAAQPWSGSPPPAGGRTPRSVRVLTSQNTSTSPSRRTRSISPRSHRQLRSTSDHALVDQALGRDALAVGTEAVVVWTAAHARQQTPTGADPGARSGLAVDNRGAGQAVDAKRSAPSGPTTGPYHLAPAWRISPFRRQSGSFSAQLPCLSGSGLSVLPGHPEDGVQDVQTSRAQPTRCGRGRGRPGDSRRLPDALRDRRDVAAHA